MPFCPRKLTSVNVPPPYLEKIIYIFHRVENRVSKKNVREIPGHVAPATDEPAMSRLSGRGEAGRDMGTESSMTV